IPPIAGVLVTSGPLAGAVRTHGFILSMVWTRSENDMRSGRLVTIRIGYSQGGQDLGFEPLHCRGLLGSLMIIGEKMQDRVHDEVLHVMPGWEPEVDRLAQSGLGGQHDVTQMLWLAGGRRAGRRRGKGKDVRRLVDVPIDAIEIP